ncbi:7237c18b-d525-4c96-a596-3bad317ebf0e [Sclerotinia trifoliorum]|uniref:7237c18b-d525-4c96-a596-3bad317ebf0e n=1 Tax=Sclerotinia trifoliorum TaxID=28548 RepID=A0A8H2ZVS2_9HELO|nr:7237c18b-d525-4c96-a596-3bad317ebf0e [Sclerotinia trifoliorum]
MAKKSKKIPSPSRSVSDISSDGDGAPVYTPPETESVDGPSSSTHLSDPSHLSDVIQGLQDVKLAEDKADEAEQETHKSAKKKRGKRNNRSLGKESVPADITVSNVADALQNLVVSQKETNNLEHEQINAKSERNRKNKERKKRSKARKAEEYAKKETDATIANDRSKSMEDEEEDSEEEIAVKDTSDYKWLKDSGWNNMRNFMMGHGFKWGEVDEYDAAKELIKSIREDQASEKQVEPEPLKKKVVEDVSVSKPKTGKTKKGQASEKPKPPKETVTDASSKQKSMKTKKNTVVGLWEDYFGNETQLANWQRLCVDVGMEEIPTSITQCRKALGKVWVNIFDFLDAKAEGKPVKRYSSEHKLATYTLKSGKIFPKSHAKQGGPARVLLAHIFRH